MALLPVATNRTSTPLNTQRLLFQLNADQLALQRHYDQLSTGRRVLQMSDDPAAAGRAMLLQRGIDRSSQLKRNASATEAFYQSTDDALSRVDNALIEARGTAVAAAQSVLSDDERAAHATTIRQTINSVFAAGNGLFRDHQLLGGILEDGTALTWDGDTALFRGSEAVGRTKLGGGVTSSVNVNGPESLGLLSTFMKGEALGAKLDADTRLVDMKLGKGITPGVIRVSDGNEFHEIDLSRAATIGDVKSIIDDFTINGRGLSFTIQADGVRLEYANGLPGTLAVADSPGSDTAAQLGIENADGFTAPPLIGTGLSPRVTPQTKVADLGSGAGLDLSDGIRIVRGNEVVDIDLSQAKTLGEILITINRSGADVQAELDEAEGRILLKARRSGVDYSVGENGGNTAGQLGIRTATEQARLEDLGFGRGVVLNGEGNDLLITRPDGVELGIGLEGVETVQEVIDLIRNHPANQDTRRVLVDLNAIGNGLQIYAPPGAGDLTITQPGLSNAGTRLGLIPDRESANVGILNGGIVQIVGEDYQPREAGGTLDTLLRLEDAVRSGDYPDIERLQKRLDDDLDLASRTRGRVGIWNQNLIQLRDANEEESLLLTSQLSDEVDADLATVISQMNTKQVSLEASMRLIGQTARLSVLNYL